MFDPGTATVVITYVGLGTAYYLLSRPLGFITFLLTTGEVYPEYGYYCDEPCSIYDIHKEDGTPGRATLWIPLFGEIAFFFWIVVALFKVADSITKSLGSLNGIEVAIHRWFKARKNRKQIAEKDVYAFVRENPEAYRKALEEVDNL